ncbi:hypothetical protein AURDEDRAFT_156479 [Auricularia subglabra TFB-10046 SS5]|nr:hypothetical protein AURDEDRAFT_156479 [Auricularia subglabra TFB-10046 SS5]
MPHATRQDGYEELEEQQSVPQDAASAAPVTNGPADESLIPQAVPAVEDMPERSPSPDDAATPRPAAAGLATSADEPRVTASPTTSEFDQAGFFPAVVDRTRKFPGTPSDRAAEEERRDARAAAMHEKEPLPAPKPKSTHAGAREKRKTGPSSQAHVQPARPLSPHAGRFTRNASSSYTLGRLSESQKVAALQRQALAQRNATQRGPSPSRAESSTMGAARRPSRADSQNDAFMPARPVKREPISPFVIPKLPEDYYVSEDDPYISPSEEKSWRDLHRKKAAARAEQRQRDFEEFELTEIPDPMQLSAANLDAMTFGDDSDSDSDGFTPSSLANGGVAINNPQPSEDELAATVALHRALANARIRVTRAGTRGPVNGLGRNHYWMNADPDQRRAILQARGYRVLVRAIGIIGHPEVDPRDPAMLAFINKTIRDMFGDDCRALATRMLRLSSLS